jgi:hypothetical protein
MNAKGKFVTKRAEAIRDLDDFEGTRDAAAAIRNKVIDNLDLWLERFEQKARDTGATVLWARDGDEACRLVIDIARRHDVTHRREVEVDGVGRGRPERALEAAGIRPVETDLGEYILQINDNEPPSAHHHAGDSQVEGAGVRPVRAHPWHAAQDRYRRTDARGARKAAAGFPVCRNGHLGRQLPGCRNRVGGAW